jgi:hypothetical protein
VVETNSKEKQLIVALIPLKTKKHPASFQEENSAGD